MSEETTPLRKNPKKALGRGLGSLLGEARTHSDPADFQRVETVAKTTPLANQQTKPEILPASGQGTIGTHQNHSEVLKQNDLAKNATRYVSSQMSSQTTRPLTS